MRIKLEFEVPDLEEMLIDYFESKGFKINNLEEIINTFVKTWPQGLVVSATTMDIPLPAPRPLAVPAPIQLPSLTEPLVVTESSSGESNPRLVTADLFDPESSRHAPSRDELLAENQREIKNILAESEQLASSKKDKG
jgi:hypothetical protein